MSAKINAAKIIDAPSENVDTLAVVNDSSLNTSQKIRKLDSMKIERGVIALLLNKRYQHVRNVLITPLTSKE